LDKSPVKALKEEGADYQNEGVVVDGKVVTADGPRSARVFGEAVVEALTRN